jgi:F-type H+-transporting ATPase subunit b
MNVKILLGILVLTLVVAVPAFSATGGGGEVHGPDLKAFLWQVVNFGILVAILLFAARKFSIRDILKNRTESIQKSIEEAREAREKSEEALAKVEERLKEKDREIADILATAEQSGLKEREAIIEEGERLSRKIVEQARANIEYELKQAREAIKAEAVELAMELAEKKIREKLSEEEQKKLFEESLKKLESGKS